MQTLWEQSEAQADLVARVATGVVRVESEGGWGGSGLAWTGDGIVVTAAHSLCGGRVRVARGEGPAEDATLVGLDHATDVAVLRGSAGTAALEGRGGLDGIRVGHLALLVGRPGKTARARLGVVSALGPEWQTPAGTRMERYVETDAGPARGFSGAAVVAADGRVLGMQSGGLMRGRSMAIPVVTLDRVVAELVAHGRMRQASLGIGMQPVTLRPVPETLRGHDLGLLVTSVEPGSPAERAGVLVGDILVSLGSDGVQSLDELKGMLGSDAIGKAVTARLVRGGKLMELQVTLAARP